jgi:MYXO-CTERM domain-containing protein
VNRRALRCAGAAGICLGSILAGGRARGDGAFPGSSGIAVPASRPHEILLGTNFGLVTSIDDGQTWTYSCEQAQNSYAFQYQLGAPPLLRLYALSQSGFVFSDDSACSWGVASGALAGDAVSDAFPDPTDADRVVVIATSYAIDAGSIVASVLASSDGGKTFGTTLYTASDGDAVTGVEIARSSPSTIYMTMLTSASAPKLGRSMDGGSTWTIHDLTSTLGADVHSIRLIAVDPDDADRVFLRAGPSGDDRLVLSGDGGMTASTALDLHGVMTAFTRTPAGHLMVAGTVGVTPVAFLSTDDAQTFQPLPTPPNLIALAARAGTIYGVTDTTLEDEALFISADEGTSWQPFMGYADIQAIDACVQTQCQTDCQVRANNGQWPAEVCSATPMPKPVNDVDGGSSPGTAGSGAPGSGGASGQAGAAGAGGAGGAQGTAGSTLGGTGGPSGGGGKPGSGGCGCTASGGSPRAMFGLIAALGLAAARRRRRPTR